MSSAVYWDTSALVKLYAPEPDSGEYFRLFVGQPEQVAISFLHRAELFYALRNKEARSEISAGSAASLFSSFEEHANQGRYLLIPWGDDVLREARQLLETCLSAAVPISLRTLDGLHLGAAVTAGIHRIVTADARMGLAVVAAGMVRVEP